MHLRLKTTERGSGRAPNRQRQPSSGGSGIRGAAFVGAVAILAGSAEPARAYRFLDFLRQIPLGAEAFRWDSEDFPLRFHLQDNIPEFLEEADWRDMVSRALRQWTGIRTAEIDLTLEPGLVVPGASEDGTDANDGMFTIGWISSAEEDEEGGTTLAYAISTSEPVLARPRRMASCDIVFGGAFQKNLDEDQPREAVLQLLEQTVLHEVGHCLGLAHTEPHPVWLDVFREEVGGKVDVPISVFGPDTVMSYAGVREPRLSEDDVVAISLLYPARGYTDSKGAVSGWLGRDFDPVPFAYVQAVYPGSRPRMGPGAFSDSTGYFHLEGLDPGSVLLWVHPILVQGAVAHERMLNHVRDLDAPDILDQWQWVRVERGKVVGAPAFELASGRSR